MDGSFNGYLGYGQGQQSQQPQQQRQQQPPGIGTFGNLTAQTASPSHPTTLPPLQGQNGGQFGNLSFAHPGSNAHAPPTPHTPSTMSVPQSAPTAYSTMSPAHTQGNMLPPSSFNNQPYGMTQSMPYPSSTVSAMPGASATSGLPSLRPMPPGGVNGSMPGLPSLTGAGQMGQQPSFLQNEEAPTHVVGSQGRRGVLPSAPGRPAAPAQGTASTKSMIPQKDADGKYPCPHCNKTYLHAKHLKRHLLRHTGDRPYMCHLCKDTFSRSDILKRHFQKCSIRRGNPTGANHLAHQRRNTNGANRLSISQQDGPIGLAGMADVASSGAQYPGNMVTSSPTVNGDMSGRASRANSLTTAGTMSHRGSVAGLGILGSNGPGADQMGTSAGYQQGMPAYAMHQAANGGHMQPNYGFNQSQMNGNGYNTQQQMPFLGHPSSRFDNNHSNSPYQQNPNGDGSNGGQDWSRMFNQSGQDGFIGGQPQNASSHAMSQMKTEGDVKPNFNNMQHDMSNESFLGSLYSHPGAFGSEYSTTDENGISGFPNWSMDDPLQAKVDSLVHYCFPDGMDAVQDDPPAELMKRCLTVENVKHFVEHYTSFHGHWPAIHMPTFRLTEANNALVLAMMCIGAVYSDRLDVGGARQMMDFTRKTVNSNSNVYLRTMSGQKEGLSSTIWDVEEVQALWMLQTITLWHGDAKQRAAARNDFVIVVRVVRAMNLLQQAGPGHYAYSALHNAHHGQVNASSFNWQGWLEQEKRNRILYLTFLTDTALVMFFNTVPQFDPLDIRLMLPADDAAWDASDAQECANALGLNGPQMQLKNATGTRRPTQPGMREAMRTLMEPTAVFHQSSTNAYGKFILIHALIVRIIAAQKTVLLQDSPFQNMNFSGLASGPATPLSQNDWLDTHGGALSGRSSGRSSGQATPTTSDAYGAQYVAAQQEKQRLSNALDKWKRNWDHDMELQYPTGQGHRRFGFCRDGVHFFYLGRSLIQSTRAADWTLPADKRFQQVISLLKRIKGFVLGDHEAKGHDIGSVADIDEQYGLDDLTLDMKLLFKPYNALSDSPVAGIRA